MDIPDWLWWNIFWFVVGLSVGMFMILAVFPPSAY